MKKILLLLCLSTLVSCNAFKSGEELYAIGLDYLKGTNGQEQNMEKAAEYFKLAADKDHAPAQFNLGYSYLEGQGVPQSNSEAVYWFRKAAEQQHTFAQYNLGYCYKEGIGVEQNYREAIKWYTIAATKNIPDAQVELGNC